MVYGSLIWMDLLGGGGGLITIPFLLLLMLLLFLLLATRTGAVGEIMATASEMKNRRRALN